MTSRAVVRTLTWVLGLLSSLGLAWAQSPEWPSRPVRLIVPYPAGGGVDILARALAQKLQEHFTQSFVIDSRPGAGGVIGSELVARAEAESDCGRDAEKEALPVPDTD